MTGGDLCPKCGGDSGVFDSRRRADGNIVRRRECKACEWRWSTIEIHLGQFRRVERAEAMRAQMQAMAASLVEALAAAEDTGEGGE